MGYLHKVRALLCTRCNPAIGFLRENPQLALKIMAYLEKHNGLLTRG